MSMKAKVIDDEPEEVEEDEEEWGNDDQATDAHPSSL